MSAAVAAIPPRFAAVLAILAVLALITLAYWPVHAAGLVWDDRVFLHDTAWLRSGNAWLQVVFHGFSDWTQYYRPLGVALFTAETRLFDVAAAPMHLVSLGLHLVNTLLVGALARQLLLQSDRDYRGKLSPCVAMLVFGLHPALVEPVVWISSQCDLLLTCFMLAGLIFNMTLSHVAARAVGVAACFFLAACAKESAVVFPLLLLVLDWLRPTSADTANRLLPALRERLHRQWPVYLSVFAAGIAYLALRTWGVGFLVEARGHEAALSWSRVQLVCVTYLTYWKLLVWPMTGLNPLHLLAKGQFGEFSVTLVVADFAAMAIVIAGFYLLWKRLAVGGLIVAVTVALAPALHIVPIDFDDSFYHERYAIVAIALACAFLPLVMHSFGLQREHKGRRVSLFRSGFGGWLILAYLNIQVTVPLWSDEARLWLWVLHQNPGSIIARDNLLSAYLDRDDLAHARPLADQMMLDKRQCPNCMLNVAHLAIIQGDAELASVALQRAKQAIDETDQPKRIKELYLVAEGNLDRLRHDFEGAEAAYREAISLDPLDPNPHMNLAVLLARQGHVDEAREALEAAILLYPAGEQPVQRQAFDRILSAPPPAIPDASSPQ